MISLFETLRACHGKVLFLEEHISRLFRSARFLKLTPPLTRAGLRRLVYRTLRTKRLQDATLRINLSTFDSSRLVITAHPFEPYPAHLYSRGGRLCLVQGLRNDPPPLASIKLTSSLTKIIARQEIARRGAVEGVLLNQAGRVTEGASSSLFIVKRGTLMTPPLRDGLLPGVTRAVLIKLAKRLKIRCREKSLTLTELTRGDEIFITSSLKGVLPIREFAGVKKKAPGLITERLMREYQFRFLIH